MPGDASRRNGRLGGRPKGSKNAATIERDRVLAEYRTRVQANAQRLLDAELSVALGCSVLYRKPKQGPKGEPRKAELVKDPETIRQYLDGQLDDDATDWYFITTERPDTLTIRNMLDRTFDKPAQRTEVTGKDGAELTVPASVAFIVRQQDDATNRT